MSPDCIIEQVNYPNSIKHYKTLVLDGFTLPPVYDTNTVALFKVKLKDRDFNTSLCPTLFLQKAD